MKYFKFIYTIFAHSIKSLPLGGRLGGGLALFLFPLFMSAQEVSAEFSGVMSYMQRAMQFCQTMPQEKVYLHFDNTGYFMGETIWFKAYVQRADAQRATNLSRILYVELVNPSGDVIQKRTLPVVNGVANGDIMLDSIFGAGFYEVRAYTRYMTNWGSGGIFSRVFPVFRKPREDGDYTRLVLDNTEYQKRLPNLRNDEEIINDNVNDNDNKDKGKDSNEQKDRKLRVRFYPEGGKLVNGLQAKVAFTVTDHQGAPMEMEGALLDAGKNVLQTVDTYREGRGAFVMKPDGKPHYLRLNDKKGNKHDFRLPEPEAEGVSLSLGMLSDEAITATIQASPAYQGRLLGYTFMHNGRIFRADTTTLEPAIQFEFARTEMPTGVSQLTLFTADGQIHAERLFFICPPKNDADSIHITSQTEFPRPCKPIKLSIQAQPNSQLSFSAIDAATMVNGAEGNAQTYMLLSSELKGYISDPGYYFEADDRDHRQNADLLMLVQGWRRYDWRVMAYEDLGGLAFNQPFEDKMYLLGTLKQKTKKHSTAGVWLEAILYNKEGQSLKGTAQTDSLGNYAFQLPFVNGEWNMLMNTGVEDKDGYWKDANFFVGIDRHFSPARRLLSPEETMGYALLRPNLFNDEKTQQLVKEDKEYIPILKKERVLRTVTVKAKRKSLFENARAAWASEGTGQHYASIYYNADEDADRIADMGQELPTVYEWLCWRNPFFNNEDMLNGLSDNTSMADAAAAAESLSIFSDMPTTSTTSDMDAGAGEPDLATAFENMQNEDAQNMEESAKESNTDGQFQSTDKQPRIYRDGLTYKGRPIVWVLDNDYAAISGFVGKIIMPFTVLRPCNQDLPISLSEVKAAYISEDPHAFKGCLISGDVEGVNPVTIFLYTHLTFPYKQKGVRRTHFQGFNEPSTFQMEDYSYMPAMEDFRRTIFWSPTIVTDKDGKAEVEFYNNSSCTQMFISCEGMAPNGKMLINQ